MAGVMSATALRRIEESEDSTDEELEGWSVEQRQQSAALDHTLAMLCRGRAHVTIRTVTEGFGKKADVSQNGTTVGTICQRWACLRLSRLSLRIDKSKSRTSSRSLMFLSTNTKWWLTRNESAIRHGCLSSAEISVIS